MAEAYTSGDTGRTVTSPRVDIDTTVVHPTDRVRWGPIFAGLFAALTALLLLTTLGAAVGLSSYDSGDRLGSFGIGAGIWGGISLLIAFAFGGWMAARTAASGYGTGGNNGLLQGAMVPMVAIPLILYLLAGGVGSIVRTAGSAAGTAAQAAGSAVGASDNPQMRNDVGAATQQAADKATEAMNTVKQNVTPERVEDAANKAGKTAWGTLISLILALGAGAIGGLLGNRERAVRHTATVGGTRH